MVWRTGLLLPLLLLGSWLHLECEMEQRNFDRIKGLLNEWAHYYRPLPDIGYPRTSSFVQERVQVSRSTDTLVEMVPDEIRMLNQKIEALAPPAKRILSLEYFDHRPQKVKAAILNMSRQIFNQRISWIYEQLSWSMFG